MNKTSPKLLL